jgi:DtxR family Mn-dependent transcriptional regulator
MSEQISPTIQDYLSILYVLERDGEPVVGARLAELLGVTPPTVTNTLKRMARDGLVTSDSAQGTHLTEAGWQAARTVVRRHMLAEWMLARLLAWSKTHGEAHEIEHAISQEVEAALIKEFDHPQVCPHGNPLPGHEAAVSSLVPLTQATDGQAVVIQRIHELAEETPGMLAFLEKNGVLPGQAAKVVQVLPFNQTVLLRVKDKDVSLGFSTARFVFVEVRAM